MQSYPLLILCSFFAFSALAFSNPDVCFGQNQAEVVDSVVQFQGQLVSIIGTESYDWQIKRFPISIGDAKRELSHLESDLLNNKRCRELMQHHRFIIGDYYVFSNDPPKSKLELALNGVWINGMTGDVLIRPKYASIDLRKAPKEFAGKNADQTPPSDDDH